MVMVFAEVDVHSNRCKRTVGRGFVEAAIPPKRLVGASNLGDVGGQNLAFGHCLRVIRADADVAGDGAALASLGEPFATTQRVSFATTQRVSRSIDRKNKRLEPLDKPNESAMIGDESARIQKRR